MQRLWRQPLWWLIGLLVFLLGLGVVGSFTNWPITFTFLSHWLLYWLGAAPVMWWWRQRDQTVARRWPHDVITWLIIVLVADPYAAWWYWAGLGVAIPLLRAVVRWRTGPLWNPAALGLWLWLMIANVSPSWWVFLAAPIIELSQTFVISWATIVTVMIGGLIAQKYHKLHLLSAVLVITTIRYALSSSLLFLVEPSLLFFFFIMAAEPKTSPVRPIPQLVFGGSLGILLWLNLTPLSALLLANTGYAIWRWRQMRTLRQQLVLTPTGTAKPLRAEYSAPNA